MVNYNIRQIRDDELDRSVKVINQSFGTVAKDFNLTKENCPTNGAFIEKEKLIFDKGKGTALFGLFSGSEQVGFVAIAKNNESAYEMEKLAVLPSYRHLGYGKTLIDFAKEYVKSKNGEKLRIGIIDENKILKDWYTDYGFIEKGTHAFSHLPFTVCFMELCI